MKRTALFLMLLSACAVPGERVRQYPSLQAQAKSICEIMAEPDLYVGRRIMVRGMYWQDPHRRQIFDDACPKWELTVTLHEYVKRNEPTNPTPVVYSGIFTSERYISPCTGPTCYRYSLEDARLLAASLQNDITTSRSYGWPTGLNPPEPNITIDCTVKPALC